MMIIKHKLKSGRIVYLDSFHIQETPFDEQPGSETIESAVQRVLPDCETVILSHSRGLPFMCIGTFHSERISDYDASCSVASICWFVSDPTSTIRTMVGIGLEEFDWDTHAKDAYV